MAAATSTRSRQPPSTWVGELGCNGCRRHCLCFPLADGNEDSTGSIFCLSLPRELNGIEMLRTSLRGRCRSRRRWQGQLRRRLHPTENKIMRLSNRRKPNDGDDRDAVVVVDDVSDLCISTSFPFPASHSRLNQAST
jgi:hypothetical protein